MSRTYALIGLTSLAAAQVTMGATLPSKETEGWRSHLCGANPNPRCVADHYDSLLVRAKASDAYSAGALFGSLIYCVKAPTSESQIESAQDVTVIHGQPLSKDQLLSFYLECKDLPRASPSTLVEIAIPAARTGHAHALSYLYEVLKSTAKSPATLAPMSTREYLALVELYAKRPDANVISLASKIYREGVIVPADADKAQAYKLVLHSIAARQYAENVPKEIIDVENTESSDPEKAKQLANDILRSISKENG